MSRIRLVRILAAAIVAAIAAWSSYWHMVHVALRYGERSEVAYVLPLSVDGVLTIAAIVMSEDRRAGQPVRLIAKAAFLIGLSASVTANVAAAQPTLGGRLIAAWPAVALLLIVEMLVFTHPGSAPSVEDEASERRVGEHLPPLTRAAATASTRQERAPEPHPKFLPEPDGKFPPEHHHQVHPEPNGKYPPEHQRTTGTKTRRRPTSITRQLAADILAAEPDLTREEVAARIGVSTRRLRAILSSPPTT